MSNNKTALFEAGDVVRLKSGGPRMTVDAVFSKGWGHFSVSCVWFGHDDQACREFFTQEAITRVSDNA